jgi:hypothetical protein
VPANQIRNARIFYVCLLALNIFFPVLEGITVVWYNTILMKTKEKPDTMLVTVSALGAKYGNALVQLISGTLLIVAVLLIRGFLIKSGTDQVNVRMLVLHSLSFGIYMLSIIAYYTFYTIYLFHIESEEIAYLFFVAVSFNIVSSFLAQLLLCYILNRFGSK